MCTIYDILKALGGLSEYFEVKNLDYIPLLSDSGVNMANGFNNNSRNNFAKFCSYCSPHVIVTFVFLKEEKREDSTL